MEQKLLLRSFNPFITCKICGGYLVDATTVTECLHTFCKTCLVKHLEENNKCPQCKIVIHQSHPLQYISFDRTMQDIVYKLVPNLQESEAKREQEYYWKRGRFCPNAALPNNNQKGRNSPAGVDKKVENNPQQPDAELVDICLESRTETMIPLQKKFIRCSSLVTVNLLKKHVAKQLYNDLGKYKDIDIHCNDELLGKDHTLKFVILTRWKQRAEPLKLQYQPKLYI
ncbi:Polycomb group RING finger protein 3 [Orchesella cincta]|uniref:Polycomb group RING finger protein 3 n=1 Tax=Orchesella cincta TaxID=48709 RepID=A0A1D2MRG1_ORCCI|nr:Polycomb group RING finger protein 3 [Orchesella cincta]